MINMNMLALLVTVHAMTQVMAPPARVAPVLEFPEAGLDDPAAYEGYRTRFWRDAAGNAFQVYIDQRGGRVVHVWADALDESVGFTARDLAGRPALLEWSGAEAEVSEADGVRAVAYTLEAPSPVRLGHFLLGSMRVERDFQYAEAHLRPFDAPPFRLEALVRLIDNIARLDAAERQTHLALLDAADPDELRARLEPAVSLIDDAGRRVLRVAHTSLDGRNHMTLEVAVDAASALLEHDGRTALIRSRDGAPVRLHIRVTTDAPALHPLARDEIFNSAFLAFYTDARDAYERALAVAPSARGAEERARILRFRRLERAVRSTELLASREKLMAGMPNYATYFGRDVLMAALMMEPVWTDAMREHVIASVLRKLSPRGEVSHEEALGGQAIRENAAAYNALMEMYFRGGAGRDTLLADARARLAGLQAVRETYRMIDDDYQFPVLVARYLGDADVPAERKRAFLAAPARADGGPSRLTLLLRNLAHVARTTAPYADDPHPEHLIGFPRRDTTHWASASWRDSGAGYANGRYALDVNAIWAPEALEALDTIRTALRELAYGAAALERAAPGIRGGRLARYLRDPAALRAATRVWKGAARHFAVRLDAREVEERVAAKLAWMPTPERRYGERVLRSDPLQGDTLWFLALALDSVGRPIPVANTDPAVRLLLDDVVGDVRAGRVPPERAFRALRVFLLPYPVGLFIDDVGPVIANDAYAGRAVWEAFDRDRYHSPRTVWGREVNLLLLGLARQIQGAVRPDGTPRDPSLAPLVHDLTAALHTVLDAVEASGLKHSELWSYRVVDGDMAAARYPTSTDIQLWNVTDLAVQYTLSRLPTPAAAGAESAPAPGGFD
ncbi:MAG TPA: hypothetical protein VF188_01840 [Longimicrobiales bacterium]